jgi:hypothetical protein
MKERIELKKILKSLFEKTQSSDDFIASSEKIKRKMEKGLIYSSLSEHDFASVKREVLTESILDPVRKERFKLIFDEKDVMRPEVKEWLNEKIQQWKTGTGIEFEMKDLRLYGSSTGYQYTDTTDIDLNVSTSLTEEQIKQIGKLIKLGNIFDNGKNPVTLFLLAAGEKEDMRKYENLYDIDTDTWVKKADKNEYTVPYGYILELSEFFMNAFDLSLSQYDRAKHEYKTYLALDPNKEEITEEEKKRVVDKSLLDLKASYDRLRMGLNIMMSFVKEGYEEGRDFQIQIMYNAAKDPRLSVNNAVYKMLERFEYHSRLKNAIKEAKRIIPGNEDSMTGGN